MFWIQDISIRYRFWMGEYRLMFQLYFRLTRNFCRILAFFSEIFCEKKQIVLKARIRIACQKKKLLAKGEQAGLSWGSVQVKTVRLQRQSEPGLKDIHMKLTKILSKEYEGKF